MMIMQLTNVIFISIQTGRIRQLKCPWMQCRPWASLVILTLLLLPIFSELINHSMLIGSSLHVISSASTTSLVEAMAFWMAWSIFKIHTQASNITAESNLEVASGTSSLSKTTIETIANKDTETKYQTWMLLMTSQATSLAVPIDGIRIHPKIITFHKT